MINIKIKSAFSGFFYQSSFNAQTVHPAEIKENIPARYGPASGEYTFCNPEEKLFIIITKL